MKLLDVNVLVYAINEDAPNHAPAREWLDGALRATEPVGFSWGVLLAFLRLATHKALSPKPLALGQAFELVELWLTQPPAVVVHPTGRHVGLLRGLLEQAGVAGNLVADAHLAALALEHGAEVVSFDSDFDRFAGVRRVRLGAGA